MLTLTYNLPNNIYTYIIKCPEDQLENYFKLLKERTFTMVILTLFGIALTIACITATSPVYQLFAISAIIVTYLLLLDKEY